MRNCARWIRGAPLQLKWKAKFINDLWFGIRGHISLIAGLLNRVRTAARARITYYYLKCGFLSGAHGFTCTAASNYTAKR